MPPFDHPAESALSCEHEHRPLQGEASQHGHADGHEDHRHSHHHHSHEAHRPKQRRALFLCVALTAAMMVVELVASWVTGSLMLAADAIHMLSHAASLGVSLAAIHLAQRPSSGNFSFGLYRIEVLAALFNGITLAGFSGVIIYQSILRIMHPAPILGGEMTLVALIGLAVNMLTAWILFRSGTDDLNTKSAFFHMLADGFSSVAIVLGGVLIVFTHWYIIDPLLSLVVAGAIAGWSWSLLRDSTLMLLERAPPTVAVDKLKSDLLRAVADVRAIHDLHVWEITSQYVCLSAHIVVDDISLRATESIRLRIADYLREKCGIIHSVIQFEC